MSKQVLIFTDSSADLTKDYADNNQIFVMPFAININNREYLDGVDISTKELFEYVDKTKKLPKTAARSIEDMKELVKLHRDNEQDIVWISISSRLSVNGKNAENALKELGGEESGLYYVDSKGLSGGIALLIEQAVQMRDGGKSAAEIAVDLRKKAEGLQVSFVVENLEFLHKGGRCTGAQAFFAGILKIRPTIRLIDGLMTVGRKYKVNSYEKIVAKYIEDTLATCPDYVDDKCYLTHCYASEEALKIAKETILANSTFKEIVVSDAGSTISTHCGKGTLGLLYLTKSKQ
ncbi:MAG: DegV family protein [Firmicutes bacterium]|nr:DegV family protein [Bacillota bacterium]